MKIWSILTILAILIAFAGISLLYFRQSNYLVSPQMLSFALLASFAMFILGWRLLRGWTNYKPKNISNILDDLE